MESRSASSLTGGLPRNPFRSGAIFNSMSRAVTSMRLAGMSRLARSRNTSVIVPPAPRVKTNPCAGSRVTPTKTSTKDPATMRSTKSGPSAKLGAATSTSAGVVKPKANPLAPVLCASPRVFSATGKPTSAAASPAVLRSVTATNFGIFRPQAASASLALCSSRSPASRSLPGKSTGSAGGVMGRDKRSKASSP